MLVFIAFASGNKYIFFIGVAINGFTQTIVRAIISSRAAGLAGLQRRGEVMGIMASVMSLAMFVSPMISGYLYNINKAWPFYFGAICIFFAFIVIYFFRNGFGLPEHLVDANNPETLDAISA